MMCDDDASTMKRWALLGPLDEFDVADATGALPTIFPKRAGGGWVGRGGCGRVILRQPRGVIGSLGFFRRHDVRATKKEPPGVWTLTRQKDIYPTLTHQKVIYSFLQKKTDLVLSSFVCDDRNSEIRIEIPIFD